MNQERPRQPFRFTDPRQERIHDRLNRLVGPGAAQFFFDAADFMASEQPPRTATHLVAHALREIESALRDVLEPYMDWEKLERERKKRRNGQPESESHREEIKAILKGLKIPDDEPVAVAWLRMPGRDTEFALNRRAHRRDLAPARPLDSKFREFWADMVAILDVVLDRFESRYLELLPVLDELLQVDNPGETEAKRLKLHIPNNLNAHRYFFDPLSRSSWLEPLHKAGMFDHPPQPLLDEEQGTIIFLPWPESRYLARMAAQDPDIVSAIIHDIPETMNAYVHEDLADAACALPPDLAARWAEKEAQWVRRQDRLYFSVPERLAALAGHLARSGRADRALDLASALLGFLPAESATADRGEELDLREAEPRIRFPTYDYQDVIKVILPDLVQAAGQNAIEFLCDLLDEALQLSRYGRTGTAREDLSYVWRPAIEDHPQNVGASDLKGLLVSAVRDAIVQLSHNDPSSVSAIVAHLEGREWPIFDRITLHLLRVTAAAPIELISERLTDQDLSERLDTHHEFSLLMRDRFVQLSGEDQPELLARIDAGPDLDAFRKWIAERAGRPSTEDEEEDHVARWQLRRLAIIRDSVPPAWDQRYRELTARFPEPTHPEFVSYSEGVWVGPTSPFSAVQLGSLAAEQVQELLASWQPSGRHRDSSPEGLGRELAAAVAVAPHRFAEAAHRFEGLDPTYVRAIFSGLLEALKQGRAFQWEPVLSLARWVLDQPCELPGRNAHDWDRDPNWGWTRKTIAALLEAGFEQGDAMIPIELRVQVWDTLVPLTSDPDPTPQHEAEYGGSNMDPATLSINTVRGRSMHAVMQYALWVRRHLEQAPDPAERLARGFDEMPEVRSVLEEHLDPQKDPSLAVHAVYGQWLPWLLLLDERWTVQNLPRILPHDQSRRAYNDAAWQAYVTFNPAYTNVFTVLSEEYVRAINAMDALLPSKGRLSDPDDHLARHLMMLYWRGEVDLDDDGVLTRFFQKAPEELRGDALDFMGRMLYSDVGPLDPAGRARLERLWQWRVDAAHCAVPPIGTVSESLAFGWWFAAGKFDDAWALVQLKETLSSIGGVRDDERIDRRGTIHLILERLAGIAPSFPLPAVECLAQVIELDRSGYLYYTWRDHTRTILRAALDSSDEAARRVATDLVHRLGARGYLEFSELLGPAGRGAGQRSSDDADS